MGLHFEWDASKAEANRGKHGVSFDEGATVFQDALAAIFEDPDHSLDELREIAIGHSIVGRLLVVAFVERSNGRVRLISARPATRTERNDYERNR